MRETFGTMLVCDDLRQEINGKISLMGIYEEGLMFSKPAPARVNKLCFATNIWISALYSIEQLEVVAQVEDEIGNVRNIASKVEELNHVPSDDEEGFLNLHMHLTAFGVEFRGPSRLMVRAYFGETEIRCGTLSVDFPAQVAKTS